MKFDSIRHQLSISRFIVLALLPIFLLSSCSVAKVPEAQEIEVVSDDVKLFRRIAGDLPAENVLIAVHGGPGNSSDYMISLEQLQADGLTVVTYDQRGTGRSALSTQGYALAKHVEDLEYVRASLGVEKVHVFGHSWGGVVVLRYATMYPEHVKSIILMGSGSPSIDSIRAGQMRLGERIQQLQRIGIIPKERIGSDQLLVQAILPAYFSDPRFEMPDELRNMSFDLSIYEQTLSDTGDWDFAEEVGGLDHRILMLWGEDDPFGMPMAEATMNALSSAEVDFVVLRGCGHYWHECDRLFFDQIRNFLGLFGSK
ncbi:MAG: alpha/beta fold hydrolase [Anaerolineales bacterium]|nr:alpha/beta fold hydrolase [Anaerolineales bacterium]